MFCLSFFGLDRAILLPTECVDSCMPTAVIQNSSLCEIGAGSRCLREVESWQRVILDN